MKQIDWRLACLTTLFNLQKLYTRPVCKVRGLTLLLRVGTLWRCSDGLFFEVPPAPPTSRKGAADCSSLRNFLTRSSLFMVGKAQQSHGARCGLHGECSDGVPPIHFFQAELRIQFRSRPVWFLDFSNHEKGAPRQEIPKWLTVCNRFSRSGWSVVRKISLAEGGTLKKRPSPHLNEVPIRSNEVSPRTLQTALVACSETGKPVHEILDFYSCPLHDLLKCSPHMHRSCRIIGFTAVSFKLKFM
jgi:hypothetical protein